MKIVFATNNKHKLSEIRDILSPRHEIVSLSDIECHDEIPEDHETLEENALQKARYIKDKFGYDCFSDDTGLEIDFLNGEPGVYSARYAGENKSFEDNINKVLIKMGNTDNRTAKFRTVIALILNDKEYMFEGEVEGEILREKHGEKGFGYDPIFRPKGFKESFAEMDMNTKNQISHRGRAVQKLVDFLQHITSR